MSSPTFADLGVRQNITSALAARGILEPFEIQSAAIADVLAERQLAVHDGLTDAFLDDQRQCGTAFGIDGAKRAAGRGSASRIGHVRGLP